jgi:phosphatidylserine synthase
MRWGVGYFGVKDLFTMVNLLGGVIGIYYAAIGEPALAGYAILAGYFFGDALDGPVARATKTGNKFGSEFDSVSDNLAQGIAPAVVIFAAYRLAGHNTMGVVLMAVLISTATIRGARFSVTKFNFPMTYCGLPRTVSGFIALSFPNSMMFKHSGFGFAGGIVLTVIVSALNIIPVPYMSHHGRGLQFWVKPLVVSFLVSPFIAFFVARAYTFDVMFIHSLAYVLFGWIPVLPEERRAFYTEYRRWAALVATLP